ncbi:globin-like protein [Trametopsis cervina]|nr:globin-like protein [Trametopsis cervina]
MPVRDFYVPDYYEENFIPPNPYPLEERLRKQVKSSATVIAKRQVEYAHYLHSTMLKGYPDFKNYLSQGKQDNGHQAVALGIGTVYYAENIHNIEVLAPLAERVAQRHVSLNIQPWQYIVVWKYFMGSMEATFGKDYFAGEMREAWNAAYWQLAWMFMNRETELYAKAGWTGYKDFTVAKRVKETELVTSFYLTPKEDLKVHGYRAGQYISVQKIVPELGTRQARQYSLSDVPAGNQLRISVKRDQGVNATKPGSHEVDTKDAGRPGYISNLLHDTVQEGDTVEVAHPFGNFILEDGTSPVVLISAGVGATPFVAMLNTIIQDTAATPPPPELSISSVDSWESASRPAPRLVSWVHATHSIKEHVFKEHIASVARAYPDQVKTTTFYSITDDATSCVDFDFEGRMDLAKVSDDVLRLEHSDALYYLCGPEAFMNNMRSHLVSARGVNPEHIIVESFDVVRV